MERKKDGITPAIAKLAVGIAIWEIAIKVKNNKLDLGTPLDIYLKRLKQSNVVKILAVDEDIFVTSVNSRVLKARKPRQVRSSILNGHIAILSIG